MKSNNPTYIPNELVSKTVEGHVTTVFKRYEYWAKDGKKWTDWFKWNSDYKPELQLADKRIISRLRNEYREEN